MLSIYSMHEIITQLYTADYFPPCLAIFDSNVPKFFAPGERAEFCEFLGRFDAGNNRYLVLIRKSSVVACGGLIVDEEKRQASLTWGMVDRSLHGQGLGTSLTSARLALARSTPNIAAVTVATSQHTHGFYEGFGFIVSKVTSDGFGLGLDRWDMTLDLAKA